MLGGLFHHLPYCNFHELNLDYLESEVKEAKDLAEKASSDAAEALDKVETAQQAASDAKDQADAAADSAAAAEAAATAFEAAPVVDETIFTAVNHGTVGTQQGIRWGKMANIEFSCESDGMDGTIFQATLKEEYKPPVNISWFEYFYDAQTDQTAVWAYTVNASTGNLRIFSTDAGATGNIQIHINKTYIKA